MERRQYLAMTAAMTPGLAGCTSARDTVDSDPNADYGDPEKVVEQFYRALDDGERETADGFIHSEAPAEKISEEDVSSFEKMDITVEETELVDESDGVAEVRATVTTVLDGNSRTEDFTHELRTEGGEWKLYT